MAPILDVENAVGIMCAPKSPGCISSRRLCDITNTTDGVKLKFKEEKLKVLSTVEKGVVEKLSMENDILRKGITQRDQIIELRTKELQKVKVNLVKLTQQNGHLAQANSQLLAELNIFKDKLKFLEHEFGCTSAMLKAKILELEGKGTTCCGHANSSHTGKKEPEPDPTKPPNISCRVASVVPCQIEREETSKNKRICTRRQSRIAKCEEPEATGDFLKIEETVSKPNSQVYDFKEDGFNSSQSFTTVDGPHKSKTARKRNSEKGEHKENGIKKPKPRTDSRATGFMKDGPNESLASSIIDKPDEGNSVCKINGEKQEQKENSTLESNKPVEEKPQMTASSSGRPVRRASLKVTTYKEMPLNIKMRRPE